MEKDEIRAVETVVLWSGMDEKPRRHATAFLTRGRYRLDLVAPPEDEDRPEDAHAWTAWRPSGSPRYLNLFTVYCPAFPFDARLEDRRRNFGTRLEYKTKTEAVAGFMALSENDRTITIVAADDGHGHPVMFFIHDEKDDDNRGGLTLRIVPVR